MWMTLWNQELSFVPWAIVICVAMVATVTDIASRKIPNRLTGPTLLAGLAWAVYVGGLAGLFDATLACVMLATPYVILFIFAGGGAGDAKLMGAIGAWVGIAGGIIALLAVAVTAIIMAIIFAIARKQFQEVLANIVGSLFGLFFVITRRCDRQNVKDIMPKPSNMQTMPYGPAIFVGVCIAAAGALLWRT